MHVGLFAYAAGASRELRVAGAMDAIVRSLGTNVVQSVSMLVSPTSPEPSRARLLSPADTLWRSQCRPKTEKPKIAPPASRWVRFWLADIASRVSSGAEGWARSSPLAT